MLSEFYFDSQALTFLESVFLFKFQMAGGGSGVSGNQKVAGGSGSLAGDKQWLGWQAVAGGRQSQDHGRQSQTVAHSGGVWQAVAWGGWQTVAFVERENMFLLFSYRRNGDGKKIQKK